MSQQLESLNEIAVRVQALVKAETAVVVIAESQGAIAYYAASAGKHKEAITGKRGAAATSGLCGVAFQEQMPVLVCQTQGDLRVRQDQAQALNIQTALAVPVMYQNQLIGALMVLNRQDGSEFDAESEKILAKYAGEVAPALFEAIY